MFRSAVRLWGAQSGNEPERNLTVLIDHCKLNVVRRSFERIDYRYVHEGDLLKGCVLEKDVTCARISERLRKKNISTCSTQNQTVVDQSNGHRGLVCNALSFDFTTFTCLLNSLALSRGSMMVFWSILMLWNGFMLYKWIYCRRKRGLWIR